MYYLDIVKENEEASRAGQFRVRFDVTQLPARLEEIKAQMLAQYEVINKFVVENGIPTVYNHNSSKSKVPILEFFGVETQGSASKDLYEHLAGTSPAINAMLLLGELENERRYIEGSASKGNNFASYVGADGIFAPEMLVTEGRVYFNRLYSMPMGMRKMVTPVKKSKYMYLDLSAAELTLMSYMSGDETLKEDIFSGTFWEYWYEELGCTSALKDKIKVAIYSCCYSLSDYSIPREVGARFFNKFFKRYQVLWSFLNARVRNGLRYMQVEGPFDQTISIPGSPRDKKSMFRILSYPVQFGLSHVMMALVNGLVKEMYVGSYNFDSCIVEVDNAGDVNKAKRILEETMEAIGQKYLYKWSIGSSYYEAQTSGSHQI